VARLRLQEDARLHKEEAPAHPLGPMERALQVDAHGLNTLGRRRPPVHMRVHNQPNTGQPSSAEQRSCSPQQLQPSHTKQPAPPPRIALLAGLAPPLELHPRCLHRESRSWLASHRSRDCVRATGPNRASVAPYLLRRWPCRAAGRNSASIALVGRAARRNSGSSVPACRAASRNCASVALACRTAGLIAPRLVPLAAEDGRCPAVRIVAPLSSSSGCCALPQLAAAPAQPQRRGKPSKTEAGPPQ
jgi:hypothetical protein